jgi:O-antigen/teichoic acid export membrane protein
MAEVPLIFTNLISRTTFKDAAIGGGFGSQLKKSRMYFILGFAVTLLVYLLAEFAIKYVFGVDFLSAVPIVRILCLSSCLAIINSALIFHLTGSGRAIGAAVASISALIPISIGFSLNWGEVFGPMAAWINVYSQLMVMLVGIIILKGLKNVRSV